MQTGVKTLFKCNSSKSSFQAEADDTRARAAVVAEAGRDLQLIFAAEADVQQAHMYSRSDTTAAQAERRRHQHTAGSHRVYHARAGTARQEPELAYPAGFGQGSRQGS